QPRDAPPRLVRGDRSGEEEALQVDPSHVAPEIDVEAVRGVSPAGELDGAAQRGGEEAGPPDQRAEPEVLHLATHLEERRASREPDPPGEGEAPGRLRQVDVEAEVLHAPPGGEGP